MVVASLDIVGGHGRAGATLATHLRRRRLRGQRRADRPAVSARPRLGAALAVRADPADPGALPAEPAAPRPERRRPRLLRVVLVVPAGTGAGDPGGAAPRQARGPELPQRRGRGSPRALGRARPSVAAAGRRDRRAVASISRGVFTRHGHSARVIPNVVDTARFRYRERVPLRPRLLSTRNLEPGYGVDNTLEAFALHPRPIPGRRRSPSPATAARTGACGGSRRRSASRGPCASPGASSRRECRAARRGATSSSTRRSSTTSRCRCSRRSPRGCPSCRRRRARSPRCSGTARPGCSCRRGIPPRWRAPSRAAGRSGPRARHGAPGAEGRGLHVGAGPRSVGGRVRSGVVMLPARLFRMGPAEIAGRSVQELRKRLDRRGLAAKPHPVAGGAGRARSGCRARRRPRAGARRRSRGARGLLLERFLEAAPRAVLRGRGEPGPPGELRRRTRRGRRARSSARPDAVLAGRFDLLGYRGLSLRRSDRLAPRSGARPAGAARALEPTRPAGRRRRSATARSIWELNRHQWLVPLGQAYRLTGDERYAERLRRLHRAVDARQSARPRHQLGEQPRGRVPPDRRGAGRCCCSAGRARSRPRCSSRSSSGLAGHAAHVERYLSHYFSPNTHLTGEALGLFYAGLLFPELRGARAGASSDAAILVDELDRQVLPDGVYFEQSTCYQRYTVEIYLHFLMLAARNGVPVPRDGRRAARADARRASGGPRSPTARCRRSATPTAARCCRSRRGRRRLPRRVCRGGGLLRAAGLRVGGAGPRRPRRCGSAARRARRSTRSAPRAPEPAASRALRRRRLRA